jgi:uncharacterized protein YbjQ (UPF0145 family)
MAAVPAPSLVASGWTSSLSVAEHAAVREAGFTPRGLVMGSSVYKLGVNYSPADYSSYGYGPRPALGGYGRSFPGWFKYYSPRDLGFGGAAPGLGGWGGVGAAAVAWERSVFEEGIEEAAALALGRLVAETSALAAHGVIGTRLSFRYLEGFPSTVEFTALGTAVVRPGAAPLPAPFTSHLDGQSLLKMLRAGMVPVVAAVGAGSVMAQMPRYTMGSTAELVPFGDAIEHSRRIAVTRLQRSARRRGWAVLGTLASGSTHGEGEGQIATTVLTGTVVRRFAAGAWDHLPLPIMRLSKP